MESGTDNEEVTVMTVRYLDVGGGTPVLLVHGMFGGWTPPCGSSGH